MTTCSYANTNCKLAQDCRVASTACQRVSACRVAVLYKLPITARVHSYALTQAKQGREEL